MIVKKAEAISQKDKERVFNGVKLILRNPDISTFTDVLHIHLVRNHDLFLQLLRDSDPNIRYNAAIVISWVFEPLLNNKEPLFDKETTDLITRTIQEVHKEQENTTDKDWKRLLDSLILYIELYENGIC